MPCAIVLGGQWGDEGKGKIVDVLAAHADVVVRVQGGANAGHTLVDGDRRIALHLVPSGILHPGCELVLGPGMVVDPIALLEEVEALEASGLEVRRRLRVSTAAHVVLPVHRVQDQSEERRRGAASVGTTGRGIGPAYADKAARSGIQLGAFLRDEPELREFLTATLRAKLAVVEPAAALDIEAMLARLVACRVELAPLLCDTTALLHAALAADRRVLLEGAQGALLDLDHGSYPFVTSSACTSAGALAGAGLPPRGVRRILGVVKAYATRVGNGPFPTELHDALGETLRSTGREFGATTGRPRRCGWFDAVAARYAAEVNGFTGLALTKLDVLDEIETVRVAIAYELDGVRIERFQAAADVLSRCTPVYLDLPGWRTSTRACRSLDELPDAAQRFVRCIEAQARVPVRWISVGPERVETFRVPRRLDRAARAGLGSTPNTSR